MPPGLIMPSGAKAARMPDLVPFALPKKPGKYLLFIVSYFLKKQI